MKLFDADGNLVSRTPFFTASEFEEMGYRMVIWPASSLRVANKAQEELYAAIRRDGGTHRMVPRMQTRAELYATIGYHEYEVFDASIVRTVIPNGRRIEPSDGPLLGDRMMKLIRLAAVALALALAACGFVGIGTGIYAVDKPIPAAVQPPAPTRSRLSSNQALTTKGWKTNKVKPGELRAIQEWDNKVGDDHHSLQCATLQQRPAQLAQSRRAQRHHQQRVQYPRQAAQLEIDRGQAGELTRCRSAPISMPLGYDASAGSAGEPSAQAAEREIDDRVV